MEETDEIAAKWGEWDMKFAKITKFGKSENCGQKQTQSRGEHRGPQRTFFVWNKQKTGRISLAGSPKLCSTLLSIVRRFAQQTGPRAAFDRSDRQVDYVKCAAVIFSGSDPIPL
jgi:hypothetical protein